MLLAHVVDIKNENKCLHTFSVLIGDLTNLGLRPFGALIKYVHNNNV